MNAKLGTNDVPYLLRRIARERPDILSTDDPAVGLASAGGPRTTMMRGSAAHGQHDDVGEGIQVPRCTPNVLADARSMNSPHQS